MAEELKKVECDPVCGFMIKSHDEQELLEIVKKHAKDKHGMDMTEEEVKKMMASA